MILLPACYTDNFIIRRTYYFIQRNEIHRCKRTSRPAFLYDHKAGDLFGCSFRFNAFYVKDRLSQAVKAALPGFLLSIALGILVLFFGKEVNGQKRWFAVGPISFQPAEFAKLMLIFMLSSFFS